jgi:hypothetical protein
VDRHALNGANDWSSVGVLLAYAPLGALPVMYVWLGLVNGQWFSPLALSFGLPLTAISFGLVLVSFLKLMAHADGGITINRLVVTPMAAAVWVILLLVQTFIRRAYQSEPPAAQWVFLVGWSNFLGIATYFLLRAMLYTVGL